MVVVVVDQAITNPISGPTLSFVFCLLALSLTTMSKSISFETCIFKAAHTGSVRDLHSIVEYAVTQLSRNLSAILPALRMGYGA